MKSPSIIIIGAGIGGITAAAHLARRGLHVTVVEKNTHPADAAIALRAQVIASTRALPCSSCPCCMKPNTQHSASPGRPCMKCWPAAGGPTYHLIFDDGSGLELTSDMKVMRDQLESIEQEASTVFLRYMQEVSTTTM